MPRNLSVKLGGETCKGCGEEEIIWWVEDETEDTVEVYVECAECRKGYGKRFVNKENDTTDSALEELARKMV